MKRIVVAFCFLLILPLALLSAATYRVPSQFATIQAAINALAPYPGDTVLVAPGAYGGPSVEEVAVSISGRNGLTLLSESGRESTTIQWNWHGTIDIRGSINCKIAGFTIMSAGGPGLTIAGCSNIDILDCRICECSQGLVTGNASNVQILNNIIDLNSNGIEFSVNGPYFCANNDVFNNAFGITTHSFSGLAPLNVTIDGNHIHGNSQAGILLTASSESNSADNIWINGNLIYQNPGCGVKVNSAAATNILNNTIAANIMSGIHLTSQCRYSTLFITGNIIALNDYAGIVADVTANPCISCNDVYANARFANGNYIGFITDQTGYNGNISSDPFFCDASAGDYSLAANSLALLASCGPMGAIPTPGCSAQTPVEHTTWGGIKALYR